MERMTRRTEDGWSVPDVQQALVRLAQWEDFAQAMLDERAQLTRTLEALRAQGQTRSWKFKEAMGRKLANRQVLDALQQAHLVQRDLL